MIGSPKGSISQYFQFLDRFNKSSLPEELRSLYNYATPVSLRSLQKRYIFEMIQDSFEADGNYSWIILVLDAKTQHILAPSIDIDELRSRGVTLFLPVDKERVPLPDTAICCFIEPTKSNTDTLIRNDFKMASPFEKYYHINFCGSIARPMLEELANGAASSPSPLKIGKFDTDGLGTSPIEQLSRRLQSKLKDLYSIGKLRLQSTVGKFASSTKSPEYSDLIIIFDRRKDLVSPLRHKWSYGALVHDFFKVKLNRILSLNSKESAEQQLLISWKDPLWKRASPLSFPDACSFFEQELASYQKAFSQISAEDQSAPRESLDGNLEMLKKTLDQLPALREKKHWIDTHLLIASALLDQISKRRPDRCRDAESISELKELDSIVELEDTLEMDRIRIFLVLFYRLGGASSLVSILLEKLNLDKNSTLIRELMANICPDFITSPSTTSNPATLDDITPHVEHVTFLESFSTGSVATTRLAKAVMQGIQRISTKFTDQRDEDESSNPLLSHVDAILKGESVYRSLNTTNANVGIMPKKIVICIVGGIAYDEFQSLSVFLSREWPQIAFAIGGSSLLSSLDAIGQLKLHQTAVNQ